ncbi:hypothetical protein KR52_14300 [Synechococcus sp. KORDI-52]|nr:hypothetical protein KR52_14300 [Synechococcus sp. KORDI-52]
MLDQLFCGQECKKIYAGHMPINLVTKLINDKKQIPTLI